MALTCMFSTYLVYTKRSITMPVTVTVTVTMTVTVTIRLTHGRGPGRGFHKQRMWMRRVSVTKKAAKNTVMRRVSVMREAAKNTGTMMIEGATTNSSMRSGHVCTCWSRG